MEDQFQSKIFTLNQKLTHIHKPQSTVERLSECRNHFLKFKKFTNQKLKEYQKVVNKLQDQIDVKVQKIQKQKKVIESFSNQKYEQLIEIVQDWVSQFDNSLSRAKQELKLQQVAADQKMSECQRQNQVISLSYEQKIHKNIKLAQKQLQNYSKTCHQRNQQIKKQFERMKKVYQSAINSRQKNLLVMQKKIDKKLEQTNAKLQAAASNLHQKWRAKDTKTKKIFQLLVEML